MDTTGYTVMLAVMTVGFGRKAINQYFIHFRVEFKIMRYQPSNQPTDGHTHLLRSLAKVSDLKKRRVDERTNGRTDERMNG